MNRFVLALFPLVLLCSTPAIAGDSEIPLSEVMIQLSRIPGLGGTQAYTVTIHGDGQVEFNGTGTSHSGAATWTIETAAVVKLVNLFLTARFFEAASSYTTHEYVNVGPEGGLIRGRSASIDDATARLTFKLGDKEHSVFLSDGIPLGLRYLPDDVDEGAGTATYVRGDDTE
jgi:hypothetical protein